jgi:helix-turn-helix protein
MNNEWITVAEAARILGVSKQAIRQRIYRDTIPHSKDKEGTVFVRITEYNPETNGESHDENTGYTGGVDRELIDELRDRVGFLERQLEKEQAASAELRRIVAGLVQRVPELEAPAEPREAPEAVSEESGGGEDRGEAERRPWWQFWR